MTSVPARGQGSDAPSPARRDAEPGMCVEDLLAFLAVLLLAGALLLVGALAHTATEQLAEWIAALIAAGFAAWLRVRRRLERKWTSGAFSYASPHGRLRLARSWGTEGHGAPELPDAGPPSAKTQPQCPENEQ